MIRFSIRAGRPSIRMLTPVGEHIKQACIDAGMTEVEVADELGITQSHFSNILYGRNGLSWDRAVLLAKILGGSLDVWADLSEETKA